MVSAFFWFELRSTARRGAELLQAPLFLLMGVMCFPLASTPEAASQHATAILWVLLLLSNLMTQASIWDKDAQSGALEQMLLYPISTPALIVCKYIIYWLCYSLPLLILLPVVGGLLQQDIPEIPIILGSILLSLIGFLTATLTISSESPILRALLSLPLYIPVLIFGAGGNSQILAGMTLIYLPIFLFLNLQIVKSTLSS